MSMPKAIPPLPRQRGAKKNIFIVVSNYHEDFTKGLLDGVLKELDKIRDTLTAIEIVQVPGAFEIPVAAQAIFDQKKPACIIALGLLIKGQTTQANMVGMSVTTALQKMAVKHTTPIINEVLVVNNEKEAYARCLGKVINRGTEAGKADSMLMDPGSAFSKLTKNNNLNNA